MQKENEEKGETNRRRDAEMGRYQRCGEWSDEPMRE